MKEDSKGYFGQIVLGACIVFVSLFFPLMTVTYNPPGGSAIVDGHRISAFVDVISGWQFANAASYFKLLPAMVFMFVSAGMSFVSLVIPDSLVNYGGNLMSFIFQKNRPVNIVKDYFHAFVHIVIAFSWLLILLLAIIIGTPAMPVSPVSGEAGLLPTFQTPPYAPGPRPVTVEVPHISVAIGFGYLLLLLGLAIGGWAVFRKVVIVVILLIIILPILHFIDNALFLRVIVFLGI